MGIEEIKAEVDRDPEGTLVTLVTEAGEFEVEVPLPGRWKSRANSILRQGDFEGWAEAVLSKGDFATWREADPTNDEVKVFFEAWGAATGEDLGKSKASLNGSRVTLRQ
jgi:hypothetical protein